MTVDALLGRLARLPRPVVVAIGLLLVGLIAVIDYSTGPKVVLSFFYLLPVMLVAWTTRSTLCGGIVAAATFAIGPLEAYLGDFAYTSPGVSVWNGAVRLAVLSVVLVLMARMRDLMARLETQARVDELTGLSNLRALRETLTRELERSRRFGHPLSLAYIDLDRLKPVNDEYGHAAGNQLLVTFARVALANLRAVDTVARVGGDEFAVLLPETGGAPALLIADRLRDAFARCSDGPVAGSCSIGLASFEVMPHDAEAVLEAADGLMYEVKARGGGDVEAREFSPAHGKVGRAPVDGSAVLSRGLV
jgi:diguanylate cyclase (GGDEF)-like protein